MLRVQVSIDICGVDYPSPYPNGQQQKTRKERGERLRIYIDLGFEDEAQRLSVDCDFGGRGGVGFTVSESREKTRLYREALSWRTHTVVEIDDGGRGSRLWLVCGARESDGDVGLSVEVTTEGLSRRKTRDKDV
ncbi:hypothetical protein Pyn_41162 [Prunus yedoensis var. nudiflora]|uniref:Uncharacterized protein n=1 Tax=Prunus yedoensis var. nudiflora TaxID=2094558 RepID=A0A314Y057_PRUYE|nr:hypothetical protein Pyn_41162 [Prunus yedoensis var. nudiflora]